MRFFLILGAAAAAANCFAAGVSSHARFGSDAFNRAVAISSKGTVVFSPLSFEIDSVALSDAFDPITKAHFAETLGVLSDFEGVYGELLGGLRGATDTNRFSFISARAMCIPSMRMASVAYRRDIQGLYAAEICPASPKDGAESWLRTMLEGDMEDFDIPLGSVPAGRYAFYDLASVRFSWQEPFPTANTRRILFTMDDGSRSEVEAICDIRFVDIWENRRFSMMRLPLADGAWFYALMPNGDVSLRDVRSEFSSVKIDELLTVM